MRVLFIFLMILFANNTFAFSGTGIVASLSKDYGGQEYFFTIKSGSTLPSPPAMPLNCVVNAAQNVFGVLVSRSNYATEADFDRVISIMILAMTTEKTVLVHSVADATCSGDFGIDYL